MKIFFLLIIFLVQNVLLYSRPQGWPIDSDPSTPSNISIIENPLFSTRILDSVIRDFSPLVYLHSEEQFFPSDIDFFLNHMNIEEEYMFTKEPLECEACTNLDFFKGINPASSPTGVPVFALVVEKPQNITDVFYFYFYPFNLGKIVCIGLVYKGNCLGEYSLYGNHVGDWEHVTVRFQNGKPIKMYYSIHDSGIEIPWNEASAHSEFPTHPIAYCALGSHGCYPSKGYQAFFSLPNGQRLIDQLDDGILWKTWDNTIILRVDSDKKCCFDSNGNYLNDIIIKNNFNWVAYNGSWGNPKGTTCLFNQCVLKDGPIGPFNKPYIF